MLPSTHIATDAATMHAVATALHQLEEDLDTARCYWYDKGIMHRRIIHAAGQAARIRELLADELETAAYQHTRTPTK